MEPIDPSLLPPELQASLQGAPPEQYHRTAHLWRLLAHAEAAPRRVPTTDEAWEALAPRLDPVPAAAVPEARPDRRPRGPRRPPRRRARRVAWAALPVAVLLVGLLAWRQPVTVQVPPGQQEAVTLPDGSRVQLNSGSRLQYRRRFAQWPGVPAAARSVSLRGEAFFAVEPGARPFVVHTFDARIEVLGTRFNVRAWPAPEAGAAGEAATRVTLAEGRVRVAGHGAGTDVVLSRAGQTAHLRPRAAAPAVADGRLAYALAWRRGGFAVEGLSIREILAEVERTYAVQLRVDDRLVLTDSLSLLYHQAPGAETILHDLCLYLNCRYRRVSRGFALYPGAPVP